MNETDKLLSLLSSSHGLAQFMALLDSAAPPVRQHFFEQVSGEHGLPVFAEDGSIQARIQEGALDFDDQIILGLNLLAQSGALQGSGEVWGAALSLGRWESSGLTGVYFTELPDDLDVLASIPTLTTLFIGAQRSEGRSLELQGLADLQRLTLLNLSAQRLSHLPRSLQALSLLNTGLIIDCDWSEFPALSEVRLPAKPPSVLPEVPLHHSAIPFAPLPTRQLAAQKRPEELEEIFELLEKVVLRGADPRANDELSRVMQELGWRAYDHRLPIPQLYRFSENDGERVLAVYHHQPLQHALIFGRENASSRSVVLCEDPQQLSDFKARFDRGSQPYQLSVVTLEPLSAEDYRQRYTPTVEFECLWQPPSPDARLMSITYPWGSDFVYQISGLLERGLGLKRTSDPCTEGSDSWGLFFCKDPYLMAEVSVFLKRAEAANAMTEWEWYDNPWRSMADALIEAESVVALHTDWKHFEIDLDCLKPAGYDIEKLEGVVLQNSAERPLSAPVLASYQSPCMTHSHGNTRVWQVSQLLLVPRDGS